MWGCGKLRVGVVLIDDHFLSIRQDSMLAVALRQLAALTAGSCSICTTSAVSAAATGAANVFDRSTKKKQRIRAALASDADTYDYLKDKVSTDPLSSLPSP